MPWYRNTTRASVRSHKADGSPIIFTPHCDTWVDADQFSSKMQDLVTNKILKYRGGSGSSTTELASTEINNDLAWLDAPTVDLGRHNKHLEYKEIIDSNHDSLLTDDGLPPDLVDDSQIIDDDRDE